MTGNTRPEAEQALELGSIDQSDSETPSSLTTSLVKELAFTISSSFLVVMAIIQLFSLHNYRFEGINCIRLFGLVVIFSITVMAFMELCTRLVNGIFSPWARRDRPGQRDMETGLISPSATKLDMSGCGQSWIARGDRGGCTSGEIPSNRTSFVDTGYTDKAS